MAPVYADHPFPFIETPTFAAKREGRTPDMFDDVASEMALVHNLMARHLNSIYLQAPYVQKKDQKTFCRYIKNWFKLLDVHHSGEETDFFPHVEEMCGEKGIMAANVTQHHEFHDGVHGFVAYVEDILAGKAEYDGQKIVTMIDGFGMLLTTHLNDEIPTLLGLRRFGAEKMANLPKELQDEAEKNMKGLGVECMNVCFGCLDAESEGGIWAHFPPAPWFVFFLHRNIFCWFYSDQWKFSACDRSGKMKPLYAVPQDKTT